MDVVELRGSRLSSDPGDDLEGLVVWLRTFSLVDHQYGCDMGPMRLGDLERLQRRVGA
jgi:hypothetical protein